MEEGRLKSKNNEIADRFCNFERNVTGDMDEGM